MTTLTSSNSPEAQLRAENAELRARLEEAEDTLRAIRSGEVDSLVVETDEGPQIFSLDAAEAASNRFRGEILAQVSDSVIAVEADQRVTYLNAAAERQYRVSASDALGRQLSEIYTRRWPPAEAEATMWAALREHGEWRGEIIHHTHDGREIAVETRITALRDAFGVPAGYVAVIRDITERKRSAAELQRVSVLLDTLLRTAPIGFCFLDRDLRFVRINDRLAEINGASAEAHLGRQVSEILPTLVDTLRDVTGRILATGDAVLNHEFSGETPSAPGVMRFWNQSWYPVRNGAGEVTGFGAVVEDITERKQAEQAIQRMNAELETRVTERTAKLQETIAELESYSYSISHDLRAPLRGIQSFAQILEEECPDEIGTRGREYIRRIVTSADRMDRLIQDVLVYSRVARSDLPLENVDLSALLNGILEGYPQFQPPKAEITVAFPLPPVRGNVAALTQCLSNLVGNAVKFVPPGVVPHVKISAVTRDNRVRVSIQDNGIGIDPEMHGKIFGVFNRLSRDYEGTGIGLAVVRRAAERMGGAIGVESELGKGSTFHLELNGASWE